MEFYSFHRYQKGWGASNRTYIGRAAEIRRYKDFVSYYAIALQPKPGFGGAKKLTQTIHGKVSVKRNCGIMA